MIRERFTFQSAEGHELSALLEAPDHGTHTYALFAHCFTCSKDIAAATRISRALVARGVGVVRFDFTGLGNSEGDFANTNFSSNVQDLLSAADHMRATLDAPELLIGHSLGGAAVLAAAARIPAASAVVTIGAPADPAHVTALFADDLEQLHAEGSATVRLAGRTFEIRRQLLEDLETHKMQDHLRSLRKALLIFHAPQDDVVGIEQARKIYEGAKHPKSFISLDGADHLLSKKEDSEYVAATLVAWAQRYLRRKAPHLTHQRVIEEGAVQVETLTGPFAQAVTTGRHNFVADEPVKVGGDDAGPSPYDLLLSGLGACTSMTLSMYARRKGWALTHVSVRLEHERLHAKDCEQCPEVDGKVERITKRISVRGDLDAEQRQRLLEIAERCPVNRTLLGHPTIVSQLDDRDE